MKALKRSDGIESYFELRQRVRETFARGRERAADAVEREKIRTSWEAGKLIHGHILLHQERADYGKQVIERLSAELGISATELYYMVEFARTYPIFRTSGKLSWGHYESLLRINDAPKRQELAALAAKEDWTVKKTRHEIKKLKSENQIAVSEAPAEELLLALKGIPNTYRIVTAESGRWKGGPALDLGFSNCHRPPEGLSFPVNAIVQILEGKPIPVKNLTEADLFTYEAYLLEITDGDTLWVWVELGFGFSTKQHVRLRGIDAPEITTRAGQEAKRFVERELNGISSLVITSTKSDKYDRYLADIFYNTKHGEHFLNNRLLETGHAERVSFSS